MLQERYTILDFGGSFVLYLTNVRAAHLSIKNRVPKHKAIIKGQKTNIRNRFIRRYSFNIDVLNNVAEVLPSTDGVP